MKELIVVPLIGLSAIKLGTSRDANHMLLGKPEEYIKYDHYSYDVYWNYQLEINYDKNENVDYIGLRNLMWDIQVSLFEHNIFGTKVEDVIESISSKWNIHYQQNYSEIPYAYKYPDLGLYLWREGLPGDQEDHDHCCFEYIGIGQKE
jgi:hypothetical protein